MWESAQRHKEVAKGNDSVKAKSYKRVVRATRTEASSVIGTRSVKLPWLESGATGSHIELRAVARCEVTVV